jgi:DNA-nicking Smr family endonuclease
LSDAELFAAATRDVKPLRKVKPPLVVAREPEEAPRLFVAAPRRAPPPVQPNPGLDRRTEEKLRKGRLPIDRRLDLHGMTEAAAHAALDRCVRQSWDQGDRVLLVITGKGRAGEGVLRKNLTRWLEAGDNAGRVLRATAAQPKDGGGGAFYVLLRRRREP